MIINHKPQYLVKTLKDPFYTFNKNFIFEFITKKLIDKNVDQEDMM